MWKPTGSLEVLTLPSGFFIFRFGLAEDRDRILEGGPWFVQNKLLLLKAWDPDTKLEKLDLSTIPIWVKVYNLPLTLWTPAFIGRIASSLGKPLYMDQQTAQTSRIGYARVCIEISSHKQLPDQLQFCFNGTQEYTLNLEYDWKPPRCSNCSIFGHSTANCLRTQQVQKKAWVPVKDPNAVAPQVQQTVQAKGVPTEDTTVKQQMLPREGISRTEPSKEHQGRSPLAKSGINSNPPLKFTSKDKGKRIVIEEGSQITTRNNFDCLQINDDMDANYEGPSGESNCLERSRSAPPKPPLNV